MALAKSFRELNVYVKTREEVRAIFLLTRRFPSEERYSMTDQIRRSSRAVGAMIGEAWARRRYEGVFVSKISEALGEATETQVWLDHALDCGYITTAVYTEYDACWGEIGGKLQSMIDKAPSFCGAAATRP